MSKRGYYLGGHTIVKDPMTVEERLEQKRQAYQTWKRKAQKALDREIDAKIRARDELTRKLAHPDFRKKGMRCED